MVFIVKPWNPNPVTTTTSIQRWIDVEKGLKTQIELTLDYRRRVDTRRGGTVRRKQFGRLRFRLFVYPLFSGRPGKNDKLRMCTIGKFDMPWCSSSQWDVCILVTCRACVQKSGYTSSTSARRIDLYKIWNFNTETKSNWKRKSNRR